MPGRANRPAAPAAPRYIRSLARGFDVPFELWPIVEPTTALAGQMVDGRVEGSS